MASMRQALGALMIDLEGLSLGSDDQRRLRQPSVGGVILFSRNFADQQQVSELIREIRSLRTPALLIAVDQEGGRVQRFQTGFTRLPPMRALGQQYDAAQDKQSILDLIHATAQLMAEELINCGLDFSFAPVLDIGVHDETVIGDRAFHSDPVILTTLAGVFIDGMNAAGMQATGKHFPGHGHVLTDSHLETPVDQRAQQDIEREDMLPFIALQDKLGAVMTAHIDFPSVDNQLPTFSEYWLQTVLRKQMGFKGLIFSDDLSMRGACVGGNIIERANRAEAAGCDMLLVCNDSDAVDELLQAKEYPAAEASQKRYSEMKAKPSKPIDKKLALQIKAQLAALV